MMSVYIDELTETKEVLALVRRELCKEIAELKETIESNKFAADEMARLVSEEVKLCEEVQDKYIAELKAENECLAASCKAVNSHKADAIKEMFNKIGKCSSLEYCGDVWSVDDEKLDKYLEQLKGGE